MKKRRMVALLLSAAMTFSAMPESVIANENAASAIGSSEDAVTSESAIDVGETSTDEDALDANKTAAEEESEEKGTKLEAMELGDGQWFENAAFNDYSVTKTDNSATISITKQGKGKISSADENLAMLMHEIPQSNDFVMTCDMTVDAYNTLAGESNPQQASFGVGIFNEIPQYVQNSSPWVKNIMLQSYMTSSSASVASIGGFVREKASKDMKNPAFTFVSDLGATSGSNLGTYSLEVKKSGKSYVISLDGKSWAYDATDLLDADSVYLSFFVARNAAITISNLNLDIDERTVTNLKLNKMPEKTSYLLNDSSYDLTGIEVEAEFSDGTTDIVNPDNCVVSGFDTTTKGSKVMKLTKGGVSVDIPYTVIGLECTDVDVVYAPVLNVYYIGTKFDTTGISVNATYSDGTSETLDSDKYELLLDGTTPITDGQYFTSADVGKHTIVVKRVTDESYETGTGEDSFDINVENFTFSSIKVQAEPLNTLYYTGDELDTSGLAVSAVYSAPSGALRYVLLKDDEYTISGFDSSKVAEKNTVTITSVVNPELTTSFDVEIRETNIVYYAVTYYPRLTYQLGESFDFDDLEVSYYYNNGTYVPTKEYTLDADDVAEFNRVTNLSATDFAALVAAENPGDSSADSVVRSINIVPNLADKPNIELKLTIRTPDEHEQVWKDAVFGASAKRNNNTVTHNADVSVTVSSLNCVC
jgi:hypothetical protein